MFHVWFLTNSIKYTHMTQNVVMVLKPGPTRSTRCLCMILQCWLAAPAVWRVLTTINRQVEKLDLVTRRHHGPSTVWSPCADRVSLITAHSLRLVALWMQHLCAPVVRPGRNTVIPPRVQTRCNTERPFRLKLLSGQFRPDLYFYVSAASLWVTVSWDAASSTERSSDWWNVRTNKQLTSG